MEYAHKTENLVVGKKYLVAHAVVILTAHPQKKGKVVKVPVLPHKHIDPDLSDIIEYHYHIDGRFDCRSAEVLAMSVKNGFTNYVIETQRSDYGSPFYHYDFLHIEYIEKRCIRLITGTQPPLYYDRYNNWYKKFVGQSCAGKKCPHFGTKMIERDGMLVCPMHNLQGSLKTEKIIKRVI